MGKKIVKSATGAAPMFFQAELVRVMDVMKHVYPNQPKLTLAERMGSELALCPECSDNRWWLLPKTASAVREGGKAYCECINCGYTTHL
jgi:hypothetical protein